LFQRFQKLGAPHARKSRFSVILEPQDGGGFTVLAPALPEVATEGDTERKALINAEEAIRAVLAYRRDHGLPIPPDAAPETIDEVKTERLRKAIEAGIAELERGNYEEVDEGPRCMARSTGRSAPLLTPARIATSSR